MAVSNLGVEMCLREQFLEKVNNKRHVDIFMGLCTKRRLKIFSGNLSIGRALADGAVIIRTHSRSHHVDRTYTGN